MNKTFAKLLFFFLISACIEPFDFEPQIASENSILVVEALLTDELQHHEITLSRSVKLGVEKPVHEQRAQVVIVDDEGITYTFNEISPGNYRSDIEFYAQKDRRYKLLITTDKGAEYDSNYEAYKEESVMNEVFVERTSENNEEGVSVFVLGKTGSGSVDNFRYSYEETFKIIAPRWSPLDMIVIQDIPPFEVGTTLRTREERVCYRTEKSNRIIINTVNSDLSKVSSPFQIKTLAADNYKISHRYSILVLQYTQSLNAYEYYRKLSSFAKNDNVFTQIQTGFLNSNIVSKNLNTKVLGYFEVSSVASERLFFNYVDLFPDEPIPPYIINCNTLGSPRLAVPNVGSPLIDAIKSNLIKYVAENPDSPPRENEEHAPYLTTARVCGDCTALGSNVVPGFWIE